MGDEKQDAAGKEATEASVSPQMDDLSRMYMAMDERLMDGYVAAWQNPKKGTSDGAPSASAPLPERHKHAILRSFAREQDDLRKHGVDR